LASGGEVACSPEAAKLKANSEYQLVEAAVSEHIVSGTTYDYRLVATTEGGGEAQSEPLVFTAPAKPEILSTYTENLSSTFADLHAQIKPNGATTAYRFEYDTRPYVEGEGAHGASIPVPDEGIGAGGPTGGATESVLQHAGRLTPGATYYYRVVASNTQGITTGAVCEGKAVGPDCTFTTLPAAVASERGYELVTPADKQGGSDMFAETITNGLIENNIDVGAPAEDGEGFLLRTQSGFGAFPFAAFDEYVFKREPQKGGWSYTSLASPSLGVQGNKAVPLTSGDLSRVAVDDSVGSIAGEGVRVTSLIGSPGAPNPPCKGAFSLEDAFSAGCYIDLHEDAPIHSATEEIAAGVTEFVGGSQNLEHVVLDTPSRGLCPGVEGAAAKVTHGPVLCEWSGGELQLVNVAPGNEAQPASECGALLGLESELTGDGLAHDAVSQDGSRVLFTAPDPKTAQKGNGCWNGQSDYGKGNEEEEVEPAKAKVPHELVGPKNAPQLYDRVETHEGGEVAHQVFKISEPEPELIEPGSKESGTRPTAYPAIYVGASSNGSKVFFLTRTWMTKNHPEGHDSELYECEIVEDHCVLSRLSIPLHEKPEAEPGTPNPAGGSHVLSVPAVAAEGTAVYFTAFSTLASGGTRDQLPGGGGEPSAEVNLYRYDTETQRTSYVATVETIDYGGCGTGIDAEEGFESDHDLCDDMNWYTAPDGRYLLFGASLKIEGYNAAANGCAERSLPRTQALVDGRCAELYRYSAPAAERGEQAIVCVSCGSGGADAAGNAEFARSVLEGPDSGPPRGMSNNGEYVFFDSQASLVPAASNGTLDTYQWREDLSTHARSISLVGLGTDTAPTYFLGYSPYEYTNSHGEKIKVEAGNVFIGTHAELSPVQTNSVGNIYDARACEEDSPCIKPPTGETAQCLGGECQKSPLAPSDPVATLLAPPGGGGLNPLAPPPPKKVTTKTVKCKKGLVRKKIKKNETCVKKPKKSAHKSAKGRK
jgi:hypothetical protein